MDRMIFVAMSGAKEAMSAQAVNSNNLANAGTTGFRADFQTSLSQQVYGPGHPSRVYATAQESGADLNKGSIISTGRELDMAINGDGWFAVQAPDGSEAYTRAGDFHIDTLGRLKNSAGHVVLGNKGPISIPQHAKLNFGADGTVSIQPLGDTPETMVVLDRIKLVNPSLDQLQKGMDGLMHHENGKPLKPDAKVNIISGSLEQSNVNSVASMVKMIELARNYEAHIKLMRAAEDNDKAAAQIIQMS
ncbi:MAG: flagellar basal-body rod protein FlgF [Gammaproteobacteria bacterium]|jgi:flagellar basal-body rod protein FlgF